jgi:hypothetical protein
MATLAEQTVDLQTTRSPGPADLRSATPLRAPQLGQAADPAGFTTPAARGVVGIQGPVVSVVTTTLIAGIIGVLVGILALGMSIAGGAGWMIGAVVFGTVAAVVAGTVAGEASQPVARFWSRS